MNFNPPRNFPPELTAAFELEIQKIDLAASSTLPGVIKTAHWVLTGKEAGHSVKRHGTTVLDDPSVEAFKPLQTVTEEDVIAWVDAGDKLKFVKQTLQAMLNNCKAAPAVVDAPLPWAQQ